MMISALGSSRRFSRHGRGIAFGAAQGTISTRFRLEPFIVTLAGLQAARGLALVVSAIHQHLPMATGPGSHRRSSPFSASGCFTTMSSAGRDHRLRRLRRSPRRPQHHALRPLRLRRRRQRARRAPLRRAGGGQDQLYAITGFASALAGIVHAGQFNFGSANDGTGYELTAIAAVVIGGTSLFGGSGSMVGTVAGTIMLGALANVLQLNNITPALQLLATAAIIVLAAVLQSLGRSPRGIR